MKEFLLEIISDPVKLWATFMAAACIAAVIAVTLDLMGAF